MLRVIAALVFLYAWPIAAPPALLLSTVRAVAAQQSVKVWVNTNSGVYHCPGSRYYGATKVGKFLTEAEARARGNRPAYAQPCSSSLEAGPEVDPQPLRLAAPEASTTASVKVWVNTSSGVYHCSGSRYYGNTKTGRFMSESEARAAGNRPAYGKVCA